MNLTARRRRSLGVEHEQKAFGEPSTLERLRRSEGGFTIIEIIAALTLLAIVTAGAVPLFLSGIRSSLASKFETQAKNLAQERLEVMRNLPFYAASSISSPPASCSDPSRSNAVNGSTGVVECDYKDLLDTYYRSATWPAPSSAQAGYVGPTGAKSTDEIAAGLQTPYYRHVLDPVPNLPEGRFSQVILTQFLDASLNRVTPPATYNTQNSATDPPPSRLVSVTVVTRWSIGAESKKYVTFTQIAEGGSEPTVLTLVADATALALRSARNFDDPASTEDDPGSLDAVAGISRSQATLAGAASASTFAQGGFLALGGPDAARKEGLYRTAAAPPLSSSEGGTSNVNLTTGSGLTAYEWGELRATQTSPAPASVGVDPGQPSVPAVDPGTANNWTKGSLMAGGFLGNEDLAFNNGQQSPSLAEAPPVRMEDLLLPPIPLVWINGTGTESANGQTYLKSAAGKAHFGQAGAKAMAQEISLIPTSFAPGGVIKVVLASASLKCEVPPKDINPAASPKVTVEFNGEVKYWSGDAYISIPFSSAAPGLLPQSLSTTIVTQTPKQRVLSQYIKSWSILPSATTTIGTASAPNTLASGSLDGIVRIVTQNTRPPRLLEGPDEASAVVVKVGILSCSAEDKRP